jgi:hypothetical protein
MNFLEINNNQAIRENSIPELSYGLFLENNTALMENHPERHCVTYFGYRESNAIRLICCIADDNAHNILVSSSRVKQGSVLDSFSARNMLKAAHA